MPQGWTAGPAPSSVGWTPGPAPDFTTTNEPPSPALQKEAADPNTIGTVIRHWWQMTNPVTLGQMLPFPKAWGGSGMDHPITQVLPAT